MKTRGNRYGLWMAGLVLLASVFMFTAGAGTAAAADSEYEADARNLQALGLFQGTDQGFELNRAPTRAEGAVMLVRILGKEAEARANAYAYPFTDVPDWGAPYVGYLYENGITSGISETEFGSNLPLSSSQYVTFVLRALGYSDAEGDFVWSESIDKATEVGLIGTDLQAELASDDFLRGHVARISLNALSAPLKDTDFILADALIDSGAFTIEDWDSVVAAMEAQETDPVAAGGDTSDLPAYTVLVYMNGSDLESTWSEEDQAYSGAATTDLQEMMDGLSGDGVQVIVHTGGTLHWANPYVSNEQNQIWKVEADDFVKLADIGARSMGDPDTLSDFVSWGIEHYPAEKYALIFWDHGGGSVLGYGSDELFDGDSLTLDEIESGMQAAYEQTGEKLELVGFDACLMATVENAYLLSPYAEYMVASEELEPGHGWDYDGTLRYLTGHTDSDGAELGTAIVDNYEKHAISYGQEKSITLSVIDLDKVPAVVRALEAFVGEAGAEIAADDRSFYGFADARSKAEDYGSSTAHGGVTDMTDLASIVRNVADQYPQTAAALENALQSAVVYNMNSVGRPDASGLSIYFPHKDKGNFAYNLEAYDQIGFSEAYEAFLHTYVSQLTSEDSGVAIESESTGEISFQYGSEESDAVEIQLNPDDLERIEQIYGVVATTTEDSDGSIMFLGYDHYVNMDWETGLLQDDFTGEWLTWDGHFVSMSLVSRGEDYIRYAIPALLNGEEVNVLVHFDIETSAFEILGAWRGIDEQSGMPDKDILTISVGDEIIPQYYYYNATTDEEGYLNGDAFTIGDTSELIYDWLPVGNYLYGFSIIDYAGNETLSDFVELELTE